MPSVRRPWAPCGQTPLLVHRYARDKLSAISAVTVSPVRQRRGLYRHCHFAKLTQFELAACLRLPLGQPRGPIRPLWDGGPIHCGPAVTRVLARHPRLMVERFPAYAPELNPDEQVWNHFKTQLANGCPLSIDQSLDDPARSPGPALLPAPAQLRPGIRPAAPSAPPEFLLLMQQPTISAVCDGIRIALLAAVSPG